MTQVFDLSDPAKPVHIRDFGLIGQEPGSTGPVPTDLHGPISLGNRVYFGYGTAANGIMQIVDREKLLSGDPTPTPAHLAFPQVSSLRLSSLGGSAYHVAGPRRARARPFRLPGRGDAGHRADRSTRRPVTSARPAPRR